MNSAEYIIKYIPEFIIVETRNVSKTNKIKRKQPETHLKELDIVHENGFSVLNSDHLFNPNTNEIITATVKEETIDHDIDEYTYQMDEDYLDDPNKIVRRKKTTETKPNKYICDICGKDFRILQILRLHLNRHNPDTWQKCSICGKSYPDGLSRHMRTHTGERPFKCTECPATYRQIAALRDHMDIHDSKSYNCSICNQTFNKRQHMRTHRRKHLAINAARMYKKPNRSRKRIVLQRKEKEVQDYACEFCNNISNTWTDYKSHLELQHKKRFACQFCTSRFTTRNLLQDHERIHTGERPFKCSQCEKTFNTQSSRRAHQKLHVTELNYSCTHCDKKFRTPTYLRKHEEVVHINELRFKCEICDKAFNSSSKKSSHKKTHHKVLCAIPPDKD